ncbi:Protein serine/threonine phosphatase PrpC, regulation of stationary phase [Acidisarcina polymorpha]|uniref:Protein serine/threonine phosphatase PrpC, regulation of stationary phase n=1 Tax=Acidisarcina polymorpha TaxID=2211140 RepID=A0A2Z5G2T1_9BACT|nr:protein phosphatase 2C domain-containing protein [Acidisarcina polymorpha]AXC13359.1 Protein serine/threonine phosphatase PrpC, regulation of stationary phase [Acidisarcina polymorpha]
MTGSRRTSSLGYANGLFRIEAAGLSDVGRKRSNNEDSFGYDLEANIFVVCDGMGGMAAGEVASSLAVEQTLRTYKELGNQEMQPEERLHCAIASANEAVWQMAQEHLKLRGMGSTIVAACVRHNQIVIGNVGDSRAYFLRDGGCVQITEDHSYKITEDHSKKTEQAQLGGAALEPGMSAPLQQFITRAIGADAVVKPDFFVADLAQGDTVLLATDGLTRYMNAERIAGEIQIEADLQETCNDLIGIAHANGAEDNVTCLLMRVF